MLFKDRADYGTQTIRRLATDVKISDRVLYRCWLFGRAYEISPTSAKLRCAHFFALSRLEDGPQRKALTAQAQNQDWTRWRGRQLEERRYAAIPPNHRGVKALLQNPANILGARPEAFDPRVGACLQAILGAPANNLSHRLQAGSYTPRQSKLKRASWYRTHSE